MAATAWAFTNTGRTKLLNGTFDIDSDTWKCALYTSASNLGAGSTTYPATNEVGTTNTGYSTGGNTISLTLAGTTTVTVDVSVDPEWTAGSANLTARFADIHELGGSILCYSVLDSVDVTASSGQIFRVAMNASGVFTLA